jgi:hypothetical protein
VRGEFDDDFFSALVPIIDFLLAAGIAGAGSLSICMADFIAFPNCGNSRGGSFGTFARNFLFAGARVAWPPRNLKQAEL